MATRRRASRTTLTGSITDLQRRVRYLQNKQTPTRLGGQSVVRSAIQYQAVSTDQIAPNSIVNDQIQADAIKQAQLDTDSVGRDELINGEVIESKLGTDAVTNTKIKDGEVIKGKLGSAAVELVNMSPNSVANSQLTTDSVNFRTVDTNAIGNENMLDNSVGNSEVQNDAIGSGELQNDSVGFAELQSSSVGTSTLQNSSVNSLKLANGSVSNAKLANNAVTGAKIANGTITVGKIAQSSYALIGASTTRAGTGLSRGGTTMSVNFGGGSTQVARGNHQHSYRNSFYARGSSSSSYSARATLTDFRSSVLTTFSSKDFKTKITNHTTQDPKKLLDLKLKKYKYKRSFRDIQLAKNREWMHGYLIEDLQELGFEEVLTYDKDGKAETLDYGLFSSLVLELVKVQQSEIDYLKEEITKLKDKK